MIENLELRQFMTRETLRFHIDRICSDSSEKKHDSDSSRDKGKRLLFFSFNFSWCFTMESHFNFLRTTLIFSTVINQFHGKQHAISAISSRFCQFPVFGVMYSPAMLFCQWGALKHNFFFKRTVFFAVTRHKVVMGLNNFNNISSKEFKHINISPAPKKSNHWF